MADQVITVQTVINSSILRARDLDKTNSRLIDTQMLIYLNKAREYIHNLLVRMQSEIAIESASISLVNDQQEYNLTGNLDNFLAMVNHGVYFGSSLLKPITYEDKIRMGSDTTDDAPEYYYITADKIGLVKAPSLAAIKANPLLYCRYFSVPVPLELTSSMPYKNIFNQPISSFLDSAGALAAEKQTDGFTALYNALEEAAMSIIQRRIPT